MEEKKIKCPTCPYGYLRLARNGQYWYCSSYKDEPVRCSEVFLNVSNMPYFEKCPSCHKGYIRRSKAGKLYCSNGCYAQFVEVNGIPRLIAEVKCPICNNGILRKGLYGNWVCSNWKKGCRTVFEDVEDKPYLDKCVVCKTGYMRKDKAGDWYCTNTKSCRAYYVELGGYPVLKYENKITTR